MSVTASVIIQQMGLSLRPEFYSGRGATTSDLKYQNFEKGYEAIKKLVGEEEAKAFVQMVVNIKVLSATCFLNTFYSFVANGWKCMPLKKSSVMDHIDVGPDSPYREASGFASLAGVLGGSLDRDDTEAIRYEFLFKHRDEWSLPEEELRNRLDEKMTNTGRMWYGVGHMLYSQKLHEMSPRYEPVSKMVGD